MESIVLIEADSEDQAKEKALLVGKEEEHQYKTNDGVILYWFFETVERVQPIEETELKTGVEVLSRFLKPEEAKSLQMPFDDR